ncbi:hypothetical protein CYLTODRAFT_440030 [Cylindrobasidium torrendii FP15055 ss-10]|uniref:Uncharacterized protein n=1 Tax=Cylindrobasidium torrendii FP15055 ss-10 TaxID=1314674 RepID=A0A0D7BSJ3_9AGAR|nr:hypothetical protein CYLTODRAFT_440030 [Cylindrobasidium torrendii FP15055 ss-10]
MASSQAEPEATISPVNRLLRSLSGKQVPSLARHQTSLDISTTPASVPEEPTQTPTPESIAASLDEQGPPPYTEEAPAVSIGPLGKLRDRIRKAVSIQGAPTQTQQDEITNNPISDDSPDYEDDEMSLAQRIRLLIDALPSPTPRSSRTIPSQPRSPEPSRCDDDSRPVPPPAAVRIKDNKLIQKLFNAKLMNAEKGDGQSIWSILSGIPHGDAEPADPGSDSDSIRSGFSDNHSIMMYSPLIPMKDDLVEVAESHVMSPSSATVQLPVDQQEGPPMATGFKWPWEKSKSPPLPSPDDSSSTAPSPDSRVWIPSTTKLSCEVTWWGYRIYLPPPALAVLNDQQLEATKRAALITTALTWLFSNIPVALFPLPMQPVLLLLQKLIPFVGYIGTFISWSWGTVKNYDVGYGVILNATWILPVALLPSTWQERDWPGPTGSAPSTPSSPVHAVPPVAAPATPPAATPQSLTPVVPASVDALEGAENEQVDAALPVLPVDKTPAPEVRQDPPSAPVLATIPLAEEDFVAAPVQEEAFPADTMPLIPEDRGIQTKTPSDVNATVPLPEDEEVLSDPRPRTKNAWWKYIMNQQAQAANKKQDTHG